MPYHNSGARAPLREQPLFPMGTALYLDLSAPPTLVNQLFNPQEIMCMYAAQTPQAARAPLREQAF